MKCALRLSYRFVNSLMILHLVKYHRIMLSVGVIDYIMTKIRTLGVLWSSMCTSALFPALRNTHRASSSFPQVASFLIVLISAQPNARKGPIPDFRFQVCFLAAFITSDCHFGIFHSEIPLLNSWGDPCRLCSYLDVFLRIVSSSITRTRCWFFLFL